MAEEIRIVIRTVGAAQAERDVKGVTGTLGGMGTGARLAGAAMVAAGAAMAAGFLASSRAAIQFESSFSGVRKTVDATEAEFTQLSKAFRDMALQVPINVNEINRIGEAAGALGIQKEHIVGFTRVMADLGVTTNMTSEQAATDLARLANIIQMPQDKFSNLGSAVVDLGNKLAATEGEIVAMGLRLAGAGKIIGLTEGQILGFAGALSSVGIEAEAGGTAFSRVMVDISKSVQEGGEKLDLFAAVAGKTTADFSRQFKTDAAGAIISFVTGLDRITKSGGNVFQVLEALELGDIRVRDALLRASGAGDLFATALDTGTKAFADNTALADEANKRYATTESKLALVASHANEAAIKFGQVLTPAIGDAADAVIKLIDRGLIPLIDEEGPRLAKFLKDSAKGWGVFADVITDKTIPATQREAFEVALLGEAFKTAGGLILGATQAAANFAAVIGRAALQAAANFAAGIGRGALEAVGSLRPTPRFESPAERRARLAAAAALTALQGIGEQAELVDDRLAGMGERAERLDNSLVGVSNNLFGMGEQAEAEGVKIKGWGDAAEDSGEQADEWAERIRGLTASLMDNGDAASAEAKNLRDAARAAREAEEAIREAEEAARRGREAAVARSVGTATQGILGSRMGTSGSAGDAASQLRDAVVGIEAMAQAQMDLGIPLASINEALGVLSGRFASLSGADLGSAGAVMDALNALVGQLLSGEIQIVEFTSGVRALDGELGRLTTVVDSAAEAQKRLAEETATAIEAAAEEAARAQTTWEGWVADEKARIWDENDRIARDNAERAKARAKEVADHAISEELRVARAEIRAGEAQAQRDNEKYFRQRLERVQQDPTSPGHVQALADFVLRHPEFESRLQSSNPLNPEQNKLDEILSVIAKMLQGQQQASGDLVINLDGQPKATVVGFRQLQQAQLLARVGA